MNLCTNCLCPEELHSDEGTMPCENGSCPCNSYETEESLALPE